MTRSAKPSPDAPPAVRCAIYTRKSTTDGLDRAFNSLDAQRDAGEAYVRSQAGEGWAVLPARYDDGGFSGATADRPALRRLLADVEGGRVDCVVVYKVDRLSRSLPDFARLMETFDRCRVAFVSVTQQFNTATSMGRLVLNVLLSFAQFERDIISERTRDKIAATRRKGKWAGGHPVLGYDVDPHTRRLVVNEPEAAQVRAAFGDYLRSGSLLATVRALAAAGVRAKRWVTRGGAARGGGPVTRAAVYHLLTNPVYAGKVRHKAEVHPGEHDSVVDPATWAAVQARLARAGRAAGRPSGALLQGVLRCGPCGAAMTPTHTRRGDRTYRYYVCGAARRAGRSACPTKAVPAGAVERVVVDQVRAVGRDPALAADVAAAVRADAAARAEKLEAEVAAATAARAARHREVRAAAGAAADGGPAAVARLAAAHDALTAADRAWADAKDRHRADARADLPAADVAAALAEFDRVWDALAPAEQHRAVRLLIDAVTLDGPAGTLTVRFRAAGLNTFVTDASHAPVEAMS